MILEGDPSVIDALKEKKRLITNGESHDHIRPLIVVGGGLMKGVYAIGAGLVFEELGYRPMFSNVVGVSAGAVSAAYFVAGQVNIGSTLIYEECCSLEFFSIRNWKNILNSYFIEKVLRGRTGKKLDMRRIAESSTNLYVGVTDFYSARPLLINTNNEDQLMSALRASIAIPALVSDTIMVNGRRCVDGLMSDPHIFAEALRAIPATHVLILANQDRSSSYVTIYEKFLNKTLFRKRFSPALLKATNGRDQARNAALLPFKNKEAQKPVCIVWGDGSIGSLERDPEKAKAVIARSRAWWLTILAEHF